MFRIALTAVFIIAMALAGAAFAGEVPPSEGRGAHQSRCCNPDGNNGDMYKENYQTYEYCNGSQWVSLQRLPFVAMFFITAVAEAMSFIVGTVTNPGRAVILLFFIIVWGLSLHGWYSARIKRHRDEFRRH